MPTTATPHVRFRTIDGVRVRYAESGSSQKPAVVLTSPWPESVYAFAPMWASLAGHARLYAVDLPGFGASERREDLLSPRAMGEIIGRETFSSGRSSLRVPLAITWRDRRMRPTVGFRSIAGTRNWPSLSGLSPAGRCPMITAAPSTALATIQPAFTDAERLALAGYLAGYRGLTREAYALDLRQFTTWCRARSLALFAVRRADIESFARDLEARGRARATVTRRLCTIGGFYKYAVEEELLEHSPAAHVRRPRVDYESHAVALDRNELGAMLVAAGLGSPGEHALTSLLALNGLRVSEAAGADIEHLGLERGHRTLTITRKAARS